MLKKLLFILISFNLSLYGSIFPFLIVPNNADNIGYTAYNSPLNSFVYNPAYTIKKNWGASFSYNTLPFQFYHFSANFQTILNSGNSIGLSFAYVYSNPIPIYNVNEYYDPVYVGSMRPNHATLTFNYIPAKNSFFYSQWKYGFSAKLIREYLGEQTLWGVGGNFGLHTSLNSNLELGLSVNNIIIPFLEKIVLPPIQFQTGIELKFPISKFYLFEICVNNSYILMENNVILAGMRHFFKTPTGKIGILINYQFSFSSTYIDGWNLGLTMNIKQINFLYLTYLVDYKNGEWLHNINVAVQFL